MKEERKRRERKKKGGEDLECKEQVDKRFPLDLDWQYLNAHTQWAIAYIALKHTILLFILTLPLLLTCKRCWLPAIYQPQPKHTQLGLFSLSTVPTSFL